MELKNEQANFFLNKLKEKINNGDYDKFFSIPFFSKNLLYASFKARVEKRLETGATPLLTDTEINDCIKDAKEVAVLTSKIFLKLGILEKTEEGYQISEIAKKIFKIS